jgi:hypothetical protein
MVITPELVNSEERRRSGQQEEVDSRKKWSVISQKNTTHFFIAARQQKSRPLRTGFKTRYPCCGKKVKKILLRVKHFSILPRI